MKTRLFVVLAAALVLTVSALASMNNSCKSSYHEWCAPKLAYNTK